MSLLWFQCMHVEHHTVLSDFQIQVLWLWPHHFGNCWLVVEHIFTFTNNVLCLVPMMHILNSDISAIVATSFSHKVIMLDFVPFCICGPYFWYIYFHLKWIVLCNNEIQYWWNSAYVIVSYIHSKKFLSGEFLTGRSN